MTTASHPETEMTFCGTGQAPAAFDRFRPLYHLEATTLDRDPRAVPHDAYTCPECGGTCYWAVGPDAQRERLTIICHGNRRAVK